MLDDEGNETDEHARWSMLYDQGMIVYLTERNIELLANFRYTVHPGVEEEYYPYLQTGLYEAFVSNCTETMVGFAFSGSYRSPLGLKLLV